MRYETTEILRSKSGNADDHRYLMIIRTADGKQVWSRRRSDVQALYDDTMQFLREYKKD